MGAIESNRDERSKALAIDLNNLVWKLLSKKERNDLDNSRLINAAHASCYFWEMAGTPVNIARGEWLISRVYSVLGLSESALYHARKSLQICQDCGLAQDFDIAYAYEGLARSYAIAGNRHEFERYFQMASEAGEKISLPEDKRLFFEDFKSEPWQ